MHTMKHRQDKAINQIQLVDKVLLNRRMCIYFTTLSSAEVFVPQVTHESTIIHQMYYNRLELE